MTNRTVNGTSYPWAYNTDNEVTSGYSTYNAAGDQTDTTSNETLGDNGFDQTNTMQISGCTSHTLAYTGATQDGLTSDAGTTIDNSNLGVTATITSGTTTNYTRNPAGGLATLRSGSSSDYYLLDGNGNVIGLITSTGTIPAANTYTYDPYGNLTTARPTGIAATNPFRYNSGLETIDGLHHYGARYYNPINGRWTQQDPSGQKPRLCIRRRQPHQQQRPYWLRVLGRRCFGDNRSHNDDCRSSHLGSHS